MANQNGFESDEEEAYCRASYEEQAARDYHYDLNRLTSTIDELVSVFGLELVEGYIKSLSERP